MAGEGTSVGAIFGRLGFHLDTSGSREYDAILHRLRGDTERPIVQHLDAKVDDTAIRQYHTKLEEVRQRAQRKADFQAKLGADYDPKAFTAYERDLTRSKKSLEDNVHASGRLRTAFGSVWARGASGLAAIAGFEGLKHGVESVTEAYKTHQLSEAQLRTQVKASNESWKANREEIDKVIEREARLSGVEAPKLTDAFTVLLRATDSVKKSTELLGLSTDIARAKNLDASKAALLVGKVAEGNVSALTRYGIVLKPVTDAQDRLRASTTRQVNALEQQLATAKGPAADAIRAQIRDLKAQESAHLAAAKATDKQQSATKAIDELQRRFAGQAKAYGRTQQGAVDRLNVAWDELKVTLGAKLAPVITNIANHLTKFIDQFQAGTGAGGEFKHVLGEVGHALSDTAKFLKDNIKWIEGAAEAWVGYKAAAVGAIAVTKGAAALSFLRGGGGAVAAEGAGAAAAGSVAAGGTGAAVAGGSLLGGVGTLGAGAAIALLLHGAANRVSRSAQAASTADTFQARLAGLSPRDIEFVTKALAIQRGQVATTGAEWDSYLGRLKRLHVSFGESQQDIDAVGKRFDKLSGPIARAVDALRRMFGPRTRITAGDVLDPNAVAQVKDSFDYLRKNGASDMDDLRARLKFNVNEISKAFQQGSAGWRAAMIDNFSAGIAGVKKSMREGTISTKDGMAAIRQITRQQMRFTRDNLANLSQDGRDKLARNFRQAADAIQNQMRRSGTVTKSGMQQVRDLLAQELQLYGFSLRQARNITAGHSYIGGPNEGTAGHAGGGMASPYGGSSADDHILVDPAGRPVAALSGTEGIVNRPQMGVINYALRAAKQMLGLPWGSLGELWGSGMRHYAAGGGLPKFAYGGVTSAVTSLIGQLDGMGFHHGSTTGGGHAPNSFHYRGEAVDYGSASNNLARLWGVVFPMRARFAELFGPRGLFHFGRPFTDPALQAQHEDHIHMALLGALGGFGAPQVKAPRIIGGGAVGRVAQAALSMAAAAANRMADRAAGSVGTTAADEAAGGGGGGSQGANIALGQQMAAGRGWTGSAWQALRALWTRESGWNANARNPTSGAAGIPQDITGNMHGGARGQIAWGLNYIAGRYGNPISALAHENAYGWYRLGGRLRRFAGGGNLDAGTGSVKAGSGTAHPDAQGFRLRAARHSARLGARAYNDAENAVNRLRQDYSLEERRYNETSDDELLKADGTVNQAAFNRKLRHLAAMGIIAQQIVERLRAARHAAKKAADSYRTVVTRLRGSLRHAAKKNRAGIRSQLSDARSGLSEFSGYYGDLFYDVANAKLDWSDLGDEFKSMKGAIHPATSTPDQPIDTSGLPADTSGDGGTTAQPSAADVAAAAQAQVASFKASLADLYGNFGRNFISAGGPGAAGQGAYASPTYFGATPAQGGALQTSGGGVYVGQITNVYPTPPPDPHTWSRNLEFELGAVG